MKKERKVWAMTVIAFWLLAPNQTNAQQDSLKTINLKEFVVTATKFPKSLNETGKVLTVIDEEQLSRNAGKDVAQLLNEQAGIIINGAGSGLGKDRSFYLRGAKNEYTLILLDGVPLNDPSGFGGAFDLRLLNVDQIERIELLKGSQSTLYGSDAIAGVVNIITRKGGEKPVSARIGGSLGSYDALRGNANVFGKIEDVDYNVGYSRYSAKGFSEAEDNDKDDNVDFDKDAVEQDAFHANFGVSLPDGINLRPFFRYNRFAGDFDSDAFSDSRENSYDARLLNTGLNAKLDVASGSLNLIYGYETTRRRYNREWGKSEYNGRFHNTDLFFRYRLLDALELVAGVNRQDLKMLDTTATEKNPSMALTSSYLSVYYQNALGLAVEAGVRYNNHSTYGDNITWSLNPSWLIAKQYKVFVNYSTGFKAPTLSSLYGQYGPNPNLKPEKSLSVESGVQVFTNDRSANVRIVGFQRYIRDVIAYLFPDGYINVDKQDDYGVEVEASATLGNKLNIYAFYTFVDGRITRRNATQDTTYNNLLRRPKHSFGINAGYTITKRLFASANLKMFGSRSDVYWDAQYVEHYIILDHYFLLGAHVEYKTWKDKLKFYVDAGNILDQKYYEVYGYNVMRFNITGGVEVRL